MDNKELIEVLERIADALEGIEREAKLLPAPLEEISSNAGSLGYLRWLSNAAEIWVEKETEG